MIRFETGIRVLTSKDWSPRIYGLVTRSNALTDIPTHYSLHAPFSCREREIGPPNAYQIPSLQCSIILAEWADPSDAHRSSAAIVHMPNCQITKYGNEPIARAAGRRRTTNFKQLNDSSHFSLVTGLAKKPLVSIL